MRNPRDLFLPSCCGHHRLNCAILAPSSARASAAFRPPRSTPIHPQGGQSNGDEAVSRRSCASASRFLNAQGRGWPLAARMSPRKGGLGRPSRDLGEVVLHRHKVGWSGNSRISTLAGLVLAVWSACGLEQLNQFGVDLVAVAVAFVDTIKPRSAACNRPLGTGWAAAKPRSAAKWVVEISGMKITAGLGQSSSNSVEVEPSMPSIAHKFDSRHAVEADAEVERAVGPCVIGGEDLLRHHGARTRPVRGCRLRRAAASMRLHGRHRPPRARVHRPPASRWSTCGQRPWPRAEAP